MAAPHPDALAPDVSTLPFWLSSSSYWQPEHFVTSAWTTHAPFAYWLMGVLRPRAVIELGTHLGFSCFVFAEAARRLGMPCSISALDSWEGDDHAGFYGEEVFASVAAIVDRDYAESVRLVRGYFDVTRPGFEADSADLLHIDARHGYEDARTDYLTWRDTVRDGGVILFHDIAERREGFGVWRLWEELAAEHPTFTFEHGHGLGVLGVGASHPGPLRALFQADGETADRVRDDYARLGAFVGRVADNDRVWSEAARLRTELAEAKADIGRLERATEEGRRRIRSLEDEVDALHLSTSWRVTRPLRAIGRLRRRP